MDGLQFVLLLSKAYVLNLLLLITSSQSIRWSGSGWPKLYKEIFIFSK